MDSRPVLPALLLVMCLSPAAAENSLTGSRERLALLNEKADELNISQITNNNISYFKRRGLIARISDKTRTFIADNGHIRPYLRYARPWVIEYLELLAEKHYAKFKKPLNLSSALRTVEYQRWLIGRNANAAPSKGPRASLHTRGIAIDITHKNMSKKQKAWLEEKFKKDQAKQNWPEDTGMGKVEVIYESRGSANFHIMVFPKHRLPD